jgi:uncharacterized membrane protein
MAPVGILVISSILLRGIGWLGVRRLASWREAGRLALVLMFLFTGATHFSDMQHDYAAMIPAPLPRDLWVIYLTGALQIAGATGLLIPRLRRLAALCLALLLVAMLPANVNAALSGIPFRGEVPTALWLRVPIQVLFILTIWWTSIKVPSPAEPGQARSTRLSGLV